MTSRPILFSAPMVRAILAGTKTQTRRIAKLQTDSCGDPILPGDPRLKCPHGQPGHSLWVKETFMPMPHLNAKQFYRATDPLVGGKWTPSIFMPRAASRITLAITGIRAERLQDITEEDANAEGCPLPAEEQSWTQCRDWYHQLWNTIHGPASWDQNPYVWAITFDPIKK